ncbi:MAG: TrmB family transcriptional regulator [Anaerolineae bacterium]|nr:TrmB family transcriptional regulator [Anaerolineae bacterium]
MSNVQELLQQLGFGEYEARAYITLLQHQPLNGYELAKVSGLPRANVYSVLQKLEERGAVVRLETPDSTRYSPVSPDELIQNVGSRFKAIQDEAQHLLNEITTPPEPEHVWNIQGYQAVFEHVQSLINAVQKQVLVAVSPQEAQTLAPFLTEAEARGVNITTLCMTACPDACGFCRGRLYRYQVEPKYSRRWLILVLDNVEMLAGEIGPGDQVAAVRTRQKLLVNLAQGYIHRSIALAVLLHRLNHQSGDLSEPDIRTALAAIDLTEPGDSWLTQLLDHSNGKSAQ